jgi:hypothetical protein
MARTVYGFSKSIASSITVSINSSVPSTTNLVSRSDNDLKLELREFLHEVRKHKQTEAPDSNRRLELRQRIVEAELDDFEEFDEGDYELVAVSESKEVVMPGKRFT